MYKPQMHTHKPIGGGAPKKRINEQTTGANPQQKGEGNLELIPDKIDLILDYVSELPVLIIIFFFGEENLELITNLLQSVRTLSEVGRQL